MKVKKIVKSGDLPESELIVFLNRTLHLLKECEGERNKCRLEYRKLEKKYLKLVEETQ